MIFPKTKKTDSLEDVKTRLESTKNKPIYVKFDVRTIKNYVIY
jgi:hypothetical protein